MNVYLIGRTEPGDVAVALGARICTSKKGLGEAWDDAIWGDNERIIRNVVNMGHESVLEHMNFTFGIEGVSRVLLAQLTRQRIASFSVQNQRYTGANLDLVIPDSMATAGLLDEVVEAKKAVRKLYEKAVSLGVPEEDARYFTLQAGKTQLVMTMNARELRHFFSLRCCNRAQWEIRELADRMLRICREEAPAVFEDAGPGCVRGACPEGKKSCGKLRRDLEARKA